MEVKSQLAEKSKGLVASTQKQSLDLANLSKSNNLLRKQLKELDVKYKALRDSAELKEKENRDLKQQLASQHELLLQRKIAPRVTAPPTVTRRPSDRQVGLEVRRPSIGADGPPAQPSSLPKAQPVAQVAAPTPISSTPRIEPVTSLQVPVLTEPTTLAGGY